MRKSLLLGLLTIFLYSCTEFQYLTVTGVNVPKNEKSELISENDTLRVQYNFSNYKGKVGINIFNKTNEPIEIDWKRSAIIVNERAWSYYNPNALLSATLEKDTLALENLRNRLGDPLYLASINGSILINEPTQFIPPASGIFKVPITMPVDHLKNLPEQTARKTSFKWTDEVTVSYKKMEFEKTASPLQFRSYLTLKIGPSGSQKEFTVEHTFFISEIWQSGFGPASFPENLINRGDRFYL